MQNVTRKENLQKHKQSWTMCWTYRYVYVWCVIVVELRLDEVKTLNWRIFYALIKMSWKSQLSQSRFFLLTTEYSKFTFSTRWISRALELWRHLMKSVITMRDDNQASKTLFSPFNSNGAYYIYLAARVARRECTQIRKLVGWIHSAVVAFLFANKITWIWSIGDWASAFA